MPCGKRAAPTCLSNRQEGTSTSRCAPFVFSDFDRAHGDRSSPHVPFIQQIEDGRYRQERGSARPSLKGDYMSESIAFASKFETKKFVGIIIAALIFLFFQFVCPVPEGLERTAMSAAGILISCKGLDLDGRMGEEGLGLHLHPRNTRHVLSSREYCCPWLLIQSAERGLGNERAGRSNPIAQLEGMIREYRCAIC